MPFGPTATTTTTTTTTTFTNRNIWPFIYAIYEKYLKKQPLQAT